MFYIFSTICFMLKKIQYDAIKQSISRILLISDIRFTSPKADNIELFSREIFDLNILERMFQENVVTTCLAILRRGQTTNCFLRASFCYNSPKLDAFRRNLYTAITVVFAVFLSRFGNGRDS